MDGAAIGLTAHMSTIFCKVKVIAILQVLLDREYRDIYLHILEGDLDIMAFNIGLDSAAAQIVEKMAAGGGRSLAQESRPWIG